MGGAREDGTLLGIYRCRPVGLRRSGDHRGHGGWRDDASCFCSRRVDRVFSGIHSGNGWAINDYITIGIFIPEIGEMGGRPSHPGGAGGDFDIVRKAIAPDELLDE